MELASVIPRHVCTMHCENIRISTDILWRVSHISSEPVPYTFVSINRWNNEARVHTAMWPGLHYSVDLRMQTPQSIPGYTDIFTVFRPNVL